MRFLRVDLRDFGTFRDAPPLDLGGGDRGLHLIQGPNEAGKSTALRVIRHLLFGFPKSTEDHHGRGYDALRVGATLRAEDGGEVAFLRRKRDLKPLWTPDDSEAIDPDALAPFLAGVDAGQFDDFFAMDHAELVDGGRTILRGGGRLGAMLFAAGSGLARVEDVRRSLEAEMAALFKPGGKNPTINAALADLKQARADAEEAMLGTDRWVDLDRRLAEARARLATVEAERRQFESGRRRLEALLKALPVIARLDATAASLAGRAGVPALADGFADRHREAAAALAMATKASADAGRAIEDVDGDLAALGPEDPILGEADAVRRLRDDLGLYRDAVRGRPEALDRLARLESDALARLAEVRPGANVDEAESLRVPAARKEQVRALGDEFARLDQARSTADAELSRLLAARPGAGDPPADAPRLAEALGDALARVQAQGDPEARLAEARAGLDRDARQAAVDLRRLPLWSGSLEELEGLKLPSIATLDRFEAAFAAGDADVKLARADLARAEADRLALAREVEKAESAGAAPSEEDLTARRRARDQTWRAVRRSWLDPAPPATSGATKPNPEAPPEPARLAADFEAAVLAADGAADRLRREADLVAEQAQRRLALRDLLDRIGVLETDLAGKAGAREAVAREWLDLWLAIGLDPLPPREMKDWALQGRAELARKARDLREGRAEVDRLAGRVEEARADLSGPLVALGEPPAAPGESLASLRGRAKAAIDRVGAGLDLARARSSLAKAETAHGAWRARWSEAVAPLGLAAESAPAEAHAALARLDDLAGLLREIRDLKAAIADRARAEARFEADVLALAGRLGDLPVGRAPGTTPSAEATAREFAARLDRSALAEARRDEFRRRRLEEQGRLAEARLDLDRADAALAALVAEAGCGSAEKLPEAGRASDEVRSLRKDFQTLEDQLATLAGSAPVADLRADAAGADASSLEARIAELSDRLAPLEGRSRDLGVEIGRCLQQLDAMDGGPEAADARQDLEGRIARLAEDVERYARLKLAAAVLRDAVERHREKNQGPVLARAGALFATLTAGSFAGLRAEPDDKGQPVLLGVRADGSTLLGVDAMSEGTADQLYLALRLASLEVYLDDHEAMPLVLDDILVNFDNARALAALQALAELSNRTQVLFFTHHDHLVDLARSALGDDVLFVHRLTFPPARLEIPEAEAAEATKPKRRKKAAASEG